ANGASNYIANTRYGYRYTSPRLYKEIIASMKGGESIGKAVLKMKREQLKKCLYDNCKAVIYEIQLYGDPTLKIGI
ncbi:MAG: hypothetical protein KJ858_05265, partial [Nanoarchaeota archaeon]|nr:hypothetical protein [Nanoarchaeota archaeon]